MVKELQNQIYQTLKNTSLTSHQVIHACDTLSKQIKAGRYDDYLPMFEMDLNEIETQKQELITLLSKEYLTNKLLQELGTMEQMAPLGVLFHIGAGNANGLSAYSVIEGLLTGNINLVKLSSKESILSRLILEELFKIEPLLKQYVYLFDFPSSDTKQMQACMSLADGIVVWGSNETIKSVRAMAPVNTRLIEWGHKMSFAYVSDGYTDDDLVALVKHILDTNQNYCSSVQGIYVDSQDEEVLNHFCTKFLSILQKEADLRNDFGFFAQNSVSHYIRQLDNEFEYDCVFAGKGVHVILKQDKKLEAGLRYGNIWVKSLLQDEMIDVLKPKSSMLQTVALCCHEENRNMLEKLLIKSGCTRIKRAVDLDDIAKNVGHDGQYALAQYVKIIDKQRIKE